MPAPLRRQTRPPRAQIVTTPILALVPDPADYRRGLLLGTTAYVLWGAFPLYWPLLEPGGAVEILAHRILWSLVTMGLLVMVLRRRTQLRAIVADRRVFRLLLLAALVISVNWGTYIYGVNSGRVVETSLGYFINPLVTVLMGVLILGEQQQAEDATVGDDRAQLRAPAQHHDEEPHGDQ